MKPLFAFLLALAVAIPALSSPTNLPNGVGIGTTSAGTYTVLTGVATVDKEIKLANMYANDGKTALGVSAITASFYVAKALSYTAVVIPATVGSNAFVQIRVPKNYRSGGVLVLRGWHSTVTNTAKLAADVQVQTLNGLTQSAVVIGTAVNIPATAGLYMKEITLTNAAVYSPGGMAAWNIQRSAGTDGVFNVVDAVFRYRPYGALDGQ